MSDVINSTECRKQLADLLGRLVDGIQRQIILSEKDVEGFVRVFSDMERELASLQGCKTGSTLLEILGYGYGDVEDHPTKKMVFGQVIYSPDYILKRHGKNLAVVDLKAPDVPLEKWLGQIRNYCRDIKSPIGVLFNGLSIRIYINPEIKGLTKYKDLFSEQFVAAAEYPQSKDFIDLLIKISATSLENDPVSVARKLARTKMDQIGKGIRREQIQAVLRGALTSPSVEVLEALATVDSLWGGLEPKPQVIDVLAAWNSRKETLASVASVEATAKQSINSIVRQKVANICADKSWDHLTKAAVKGLRYRYEGGNGYHPVPQTKGVPPNLYVGGLSTEDAKKVIQQLEAILSK